MNKNELRKAAIDYLKENPDTFIDCINDLDSWNGFADGYRAFPMDDLDELFGDVKLSDFLSKLGSSFNYKDDYFLDTIYGLESTDDIEGWYKDHTSEEEVLDNLIDNYPNVNIWDKDFNDLVYQIVYYEEEEEE